MIEFEFDPIKSDSNERKHGINFAVAQKLWLDPNLLILPSKYPEEPRFLAIGSIGTSCWTGIFTERGDAVRIISVRRSRIEEEKLYENNQS